MGGSNVEGGEEDLIGTVFGKAHELASLGLRYDELTTE
jgi:hypothetical protein